MSNNSNNNTHRHCLCPFCDWAFCSRWQCTLVLGQALERARRQIKEKTIVGIDGAGRIRLAPSPPRPDKPAMTFYLTRTPGWYAIYWAEKGTSGYKECCRESLVAAVAKYLST